MASSPVLTTAPATLPPQASDAELIGRAFNLWRTAFRRTWRGTAIPTVMVPLGFLAAMGMGLGSLVNSGPRAAALGGVDYLDFIAPGLLAATVMQQATFESSYPVLGAIKWARQYIGQLATPLRVRDVLAGHLLWIALRLAIGAAVFVVIALLFGTVHSWWALLVVPAAVVTGMAFAPAIFAFAATLETDSGFALIFRFAIMPMFLFSGTFFPVSQLPDWLEPAAWVVPLWHGVELCRDLTLGTPSVLADLGHLGYLGLWAAGGFALALRNFTKRLVT